MKFAFLFILSFIACTKTPQQKTESQTADTLRVAIGAEPSSLDWTYASDGVANEIFVNIMEGLIRYDITKSEMPLMPALAEKWEITPNGTTLQFEIRPGVKWSDGKPLIAQHFVDGIENALNPKTASNYGYLLFPIKNAKEYGSGKVKDFSKVGVKATSELSLTIQLEKPASFFPYVLTQPVSYPIRKDIMALHGNRWTEAKNMVCLGPYLLKEWEHEKRIHLERNSSYWGLPAKIQKIEMVIVPENSTALNLFETGHIDYLHYLSNSDIPRFQNKPEFHQTTTPGTIFIGFNLKNKAFADPRVRKAVGHAIDRKQLATIAGGQKIPFKGWIPPRILGHSPDVGLEFNVSKAQQLYAAAQKSSSAKKVSWKLLINSDKSQQALAENVQHQLKQNLGVDVEILQREWKVFLDEQGKASSDFFFSAWLADYPDPNNFANLLTSYTENNRTGWKSSQYDQWIEAAAQERNTKTREDLYLKSQKLALEQDAVVLPLLLMSRSSLISSRVIDAPFNAYENYRYDRAQLR